MLRIYFHAQMSLLEEEIRLRRKLRPPEKRGSAVCKKRASQKYTTRNSSLSLTFLYISSNCKLLTILILSL